MQTCSAEASARHVQRAGMGLSDVVRGTPNFNALLSSSEILLKHSDASAAYRQIDAFGLTFMPAGDCSRDASELLGSHQMSAIIESWRDKFDYVLIDTPPILPLTDAVVLSRRVDAVIVVVRFAVTSQPCIQRTIRLLKMSSAKARDADQRDGPSFAGVLPILRVLWRVRLC